jgi:two-component sensor histidine kinase
MIDPVLSQRLDQINRKLDHQHELLHNLIERQADEKDLLRDTEERVISMSVITDRLAAGVVQLTDAATASKKLMTDLAQLVRDNVNDPAALTQIATDIENNAAALAASVVANTPAAPTAEPPVEPAP